MTVDEWDLLNMTNPLAHLRPMPLNGTVVKGLPSNTYWSFTGGLREAAKANAAAVAVDDQGLAAFGEATGAETPDAEMTLGASCRGSSTSAWPALAAHSGAPIAASGPSAGRPRGLPTICCASRPSRRLRTRGTRSTTG